MSEVTAWFLYSIVVANLLGLAAVAGESALRDSGRSGRWAWVVAMAGSVSLPVLAWLGVSLRSVPAVPDSALIPLAPLASVTVRASGGVASAGPNVDQVLLVAWIVVSVVVFVYLSLSWAAIMRDRRNWRPASIGGVRVAVTPDTGPAAWGIRHPEILLPEWATELESRVRRLMLLHEGEHVRAGDTRVVLAGLILLAVAPWNLPLWWQFRRLRQAIELDCDSRVLRRAPDARRYGRLLLEVGRRRAAPVMAVALADPPSFLERRIRLITARARIPSLRRIGGLALLATGFATVAVCTRDPMAVETDPVDAVAAADPALAGPAFTPFTVPPRLQNGAEIQRLLEEQYPPLLREAGIGGSVEVWFYIGENGEILKIQTKESSGYPALDQAAIAVGSAMQFSPAMNRDEPVNVWVSLPIRFRSVAEAVTEAHEADRVESQPTTDPALATDSGAGSRSEYGAIFQETADGQAASEATAPDSPVDPVPVDRSAAIDARTRAARVREAPDGTPDALLKDVSVRQRQTTSSIASSAITAVSERPSGATLRTPQPTPHESVTAEPEPRTPTSQPELQNLSEIQVLIEQEYPSLLRDAGIGGRAAVMSLVGTDGSVVRMQIEQGTGHPALDEAALRVASAMRFAPARNGGEAVPVWVRLPISFESR